MATKLLPQQCFKGEGVTNHQRRQEIYYCQIDCIISRTFGIDCIDKEDCRFFEGEHKYVDIELIFALVAKLTEVRTPSVSVAKKAKPALFYIMICTFSVIAMMLL